ncbi:MAG TPA: SpoIIE family protein phosphatase [Acidimicrobiia bacterium]
MADSIAGRLIGLDAGLLDHVDAAVIVTTLDGEILYANRYCEVLYGRPSSHLVGEQSTVFSADPVEPAQRAEIGRAILAGRSWEGDFRVARSDGSIVSVHAVDSPLFGPHGSVTGVVSVAFDVTERSAREEHISARYDDAQFLADVGTLLASELEYPKIFVRLAELCVPYLADLCLIDVADGVEIRRMAAVHADPAKHELVRELEERYPPDGVGDHPAVHVLRGGAPEIRGAMSEEFLRRNTRDDEHFEIVQALGLTSYMCVPLQARGATLGALTLVSAGSGRRFEARDLAYAEDLARRAALALDNARLLDERTHVAQALQASLLPPSMPEIPGLELSARYQPAGQGLEVGGDFYDVFEVAPAQWAVVIGDVSGKGPEAGAIAGLARHTLRAGLLRERTPSRLLELLHEALRSNEAADDRFCTVCLTVLDVPGRRRRRRAADLTVSCGGHPLPIVVRRDGRAERVECRGTLLGLTDEVTLVDQEVRLRRGDVAIFYTDGITEAHDPGQRILGEQRLIDVVQRNTHLDTDELADRILLEANHSVSGPPRDDMALLVLRVTSPPSSRRRRAA